MAAFAVQERMRQWDAQSENRARSKRDDDEWMSSHVDVHV